MEDLLQKLVVALGEYLEGNMSLQQIEEEFTSPIIADDTKSEVPQNIIDIVYALDMWEISNLTRNDMLEMRKLLSKYLNS